jgi:hypothetical protein
MAKTYRFSYTPGELKNSRYIDNKNRTFKINTVWCGGVGGEVQSVELLNETTQQTNLIDIKDFKSFIDQEMLIKI